MPLQAPLPPRTFVYVRHGQTDWNLEHRTQGSTDTPLNETGRQQAAHSAQRLKASGQRISRICCSPLARAQETAHIIAAVLGRPVSVIDRLREANFGEKEGQARGDWLAAWRKGLTPQGAEPYPDFLQRVALGLNEALHESADALVVAHLAVYWGVEQALGRPAGPETGNGVPLLHTPPVAGSAHWTISPL